MCAGEDESIHDTILFLNSRTFPISLDSVPRLSTILGQPMKTLCPIFLLFVSLLLCGGCSKQQKQAPAEAQDDFIRLMNSGKNYLDQAQAEKALEIYTQAAELAPTDVDVHLNLANSHLLAGNAEKAIAEADETLKLDPNSAAAYYVKGCAFMRLSNWEEAVKALSTARKIDPSEPALAFQLGLAHLQLKQYEEAIALLSEVVTVQPDHPSAHYQLSQAFLRAGREEDAQRELQAHQEIATSNAGTTLTPARLEKSRFTEARVPFRLEQPAATGIPVKFLDATAETLGTNANSLRGPVALVDPNRSGWSSLLLRDQEGWRLYWNTNGRFQPLEEVFPAIEGANYSKTLVGDLNNDRFEDILVLGDKGSHLFKMGTNGMMMDVGQFSRLRNLHAIDGALVDLDFTGKLDLLAVTSGTNQVRLFRQFGPLLFTDITRTSGIPANLTNAFQLAVDDWPKDEMMDVIVGRQNEPPLLLAKVRGGPLVATNMANWPAGGGVIATGDLNNDLRVDIVTAAGDKVRIAFNGTGESRELNSGDSSIRQIALQDFDNDGWLDIWTVGSRLTLWRNAGQAGFVNVTAATGLDKLTGPFASVAFADLDGDCDTEAILTLADNQVRILKNEGGNANGQVKVRLFGNRSNASGIGVKLETTAGGLRLIRTVQNLPIEIGVGKNQKLDSFIVHWFNLADPSIDVAVDCTNPLYVIELTLPDGSCPYMYAWDGENYRFVTDLLGAAPAGLPVAEGRYIESDPDEFAWIGTDENFKPKDGFYTVQITEELREALYLDEAKLAVVDHPPGVEVHPLDKLMPGRPFPPNKLAAFHNEHPLLRARAGSDERDVTDLLRVIDNRRVSPEKLRVPQMRGQAEPFSVTLDYGPLDTSRPLALVLNGWLLFGGGMANIHASQDPSVPFPFPTLEAEVNGAWEKVEVTVGAPAGKTKTIVADLTGKLPGGTRRLRLTTGFEIHWDRIALMEPLPADSFTMSLVTPDQADLHWRGFSDFEDLPWGFPLTPNYNKVNADPKWRITPGGWCTRYGDVSELIVGRDDGLMIMNGGDELTLKFAAENLPTRPAGFVREYFIYTDGWDKDSDFHVAAGTTVEPLPWHGMDDQLYGKEKRPEFASDTLHRKYNTRWVPPNILHSRRH